MFGKLRKVKKNFLHIRSTMCVGFFFNGNPYCVHFTQKKFKSGTIKKNTVPFTQCRLAVSVL